MPWLMQEGQCTIPLTFQSRCRGWDDSENIDAPNRRHRGRPKVLCAVAVATTTTTTKVVTAQQACALLYLFAYADTGSARR